MIKYIVVSLLLLYIGIRFYKHIQRYVLVFSSIFSPEINTSSKQNQRTKKQSGDISIQYRDRNKKNESFEDYTDYEEVK